MITEEDVMEIIRKQVEEIIDEEVGHVYDRVKDRMHKLIPQVVMYMDDHLNFTRDENKITIEILHRTEERETGNE